MILAVKTAIGNNKRFWNYVNGTPRNWHNVSAYTEEAIESQKRSISSEKRVRGRVEELPDHIAHPPKEGLSSDRQKALEDKMQKYRDLAEKGDLK